MKYIIKQFQVFGDFISSERYGSGHINETYKVVMNVSGQPVLYLAQRINHNVFKNPALVQENIQRVTRHIASKLDSNDPDASRKTLTLIPTLDNKTCYHAPDGSWWRIYLFITQAQTYDVLTSEDQAYVVGRAFATFQNQLADLPAPRLNETIPFFHHTVKRFEAFQSALQADAFNRAKEVKPEIDFLEKRASHYSRLLDLQAKGIIPERITHNDTKLNNVMLDDVTGAGICVIDLDTVMPGLVHYDFGDMCRTGTAATAEDERDLSKVESRIEMFRAIANGYCSAATFLTPAEQAELAFSARLITLTIAIRFLTDYLSGDTYFHISRPGHNLDRCRVQQKMVLSMEEQSDAMEKIIQEATVR
jgi:Ser/Thr protein kinase RdoA (MazF antagonist)